MSENIKNKPFPRVWVFSMSAYLRGLHKKKKDIWIEMPHVAERLKILTELFGLKA